MLLTRQFIPCDYPPLQCSNDIEHDLRSIKGALANYFDDSPEATAQAAADEREHTCNLCGKSNLVEVIDLGRMPLSHQLRKNLDVPEKTYPVKFHLCMHCELLQIRDPIPPESLYDSDTYITGFQKPKHIDDLICTVITHRAPESVLDIGCNDGSLLEALKAQGFTRLAGIEPNPHAAAAARVRGFPVDVDFLTADSTSRLLEGHHRFETIFARHVLEHVTHLGDFFACIDRLLADDGLLVIELPHVETGFFANNPVILWEEHVNYFTEDCVKAMLAYHSFDIIDRRHYAFGGVSVAFIASRSKVRVSDIKGAGKFPLAFYERYDYAIRELKSHLNDLVTLARASGYTIALYGAAPRSCMLINYAGLGSSIDWVIDDRAEIQGRIMPGTSRVIHGLAESALPAGRPILVLLGVGAENEHKVIARLKAKLGMLPVSVSLFPPRDIRKSLELAKEQVRLEKPAQPEAGAITGIDWFRYVRGHPTDGEPQGESLAITVNAQ